jgi:hypothetical protein
MDTWESFFREKSRRRSASQRRARLAKAAIVALLMIDIAIIAWLFATRFR